jgi:hypothetical protein
MNDFTLLITLGKRIPWLRNSMEILLGDYDVKGYNEISIQQSTAMVADYFNEFTVNKIRIQFPPMLIKPLKFSNVGSYNLDDRKFIVSMDNAVHSITVKRSLH